MSRYRLYNVHGVVVAAADDLMALIDNNWESIKADPLGMDVERVFTGCDSESGVVRYDHRLPGMVISWKDRK